MSESEITRRVLLEEARRLLTSLNQGEMSANAYDTAWVARIPSPTLPSQPLFPAAYDWLLRNQRVDGSWGAEIPFARDRIVSTLGAILALSQGEFRRGESEMAARRAVVYLNRDRPNLHDDTSDTVGFELLLPELARQAQNLRISLPYEDWRFVEAIKVNKLERIPPAAIYGGPTTLTTSIEYLGDSLIKSLLPRCQSQVGSFGGSPSATAYAVIHGVGESAAVPYLNQVTALDADGGVLGLHPFEVFETAWVLYYLRDVGFTKEELEPHLVRLTEGWTSLGTSWTKEGTPPDVNDTAVALMVLKQAGRNPEPSVFLPYEAPDYFYTFAFERNPSVTSNAHVLEALRSYPSNPDHRRMIVKILHYLEQEQIEGTHWIDKWHVSPFYATEQVVRALGDLAPHLVRPAVQWMMEMQHEDGRWGFGDGTIEETAMALIALDEAAVADLPLRNLVDDALRRAATYIAQHMDRDSYTPMWQGKALYTAPKIVRAVILASLIRSASWNESRPIGRGGGFG